MPNPSYRTEQQIAIQAVRTAAGLCRTVQAELVPNALQKRDRSPVTVADFGSQALICRALHQAFPEDPIVAEEGSGALRQPENAPILAQVMDHVQVYHPGASAAELCTWIDYGDARTYSDRFWTLDPIDGTKGFLRREQYVLALALIVQGEVAVAVLACPNLPLSPDTPALAGSLFVAVRGQGSLAYPLTSAGLEPNEDPTPIRVSGQTDPTQARFCESVESGHSAHGDSAALAAHLGMVTEPLRMDSQAKYAVVARGEADVYLRFPTDPTYQENIWDHAAGALITLEAGGRVTDIAGRPLDFRHGPKLIHNRGIVVTNQALHGQVLEAIAAVGVGVPRS